MAYELSGAEAVLADQMEAEDPRGAPVEARCGYWRSRRAALNASPQVLTNRAGVVGTTRYDALRAWAAQRVVVACAAAAEKRAKEEATRQQQAATAAAQRAAAQKEAEAKAAADALAAWRTTCESAKNPYIGPSSGVSEECLRVATRACQLNADSEPCATVRAEQKAAQERRAEQDAKAAHEKAVDMIDEIERELRQVKPPWSEERVNTFGRLAELFRRIPRKCRSLPDGAGTSREGRGTHGCTASRLHEGAPRPAIGGRRAPGAIDHAEVQGRD